MRVLIVDDEDVICSGLRTLTEHIALPEITSIETTTDPTKALESIRANPPEIVMTDVLMPTLSGLELMEQVRATAPSIRFIVISGHDDFALVRQALKHQATDYLLKPATTEELRGALTRTIEAIREFQAQKRVPLALVSETIEGLARGEHPDQARLELMAGSVRDLLPGPFVQLGILEAASERADPSPERIIEETDHALTGSELSLLDVPLTETIRCVLITGQSVASLSRATARMGRRAARAHNARVVLSLSSVSRSLELLPLLYREAHVASARKLLKTDAVVRYRDQTSDSSLPSGAIAEIEAFESLVAAHNEVAVAARVDGIEESPWLSVSFLSRLRQIVTVRTNVAIPPLDRFFSVKQLTSCLVQAIASAGKDEHQPGVLPTLQSGREATLVDEAKRFVLTDLKNNADLSTVAAHVGLSYSYFSTVFKEHAGTPFSDFVRDARMSEARRLLGARGMSVGEVAKRVGYQHAKHFSRAFKHYYGATPRAYGASLRAGAGDP